MYAIIEAGGRQHKAVPGKTVKMQLLDAPVGSEVVFDRVLAVHDGEKLIVGTPYVEGAKVRARVIQHGRDKKIIVFKFKRKTGYRKKQGHRQWFTVVEVLQVDTPSG